MQNPLDSVACAVWPTRLPNAAPQHVKNYDGTRWWDAGAVFSARAGGTRRGPPARAIARLRRGFGASRHRGAERASSSSRGATLPRPPIDAKPGLSGDDSEQSDDQDVVQSRCRRDLRTAMPWPRASSAIRRFSPAVATYRHGRTGRSRRRRRHDHSRLNALGGRETYCREVRIGEVG